MKRRIALIGALAFALSGCRQITAALVPTPAPDAVETAMPEQTQTQSNVNENSLHPNEVTDYDRKAVTSLINEELRKQHGKTGYYTLRSEDITFEKNNGIIKATGLYTYRENGVNKTVPFEYEYEDKNLEYLLSDGKEGGDVVQSETPQEDKQGEKSTLVPDKTYDFNAVHGVTVNVMHAGDGVMTVQVVDAEGNLVAEVFNQPGDYTESKNVDLPTGSYQLWFKNESGNWSLSYNAY